MAANESVTEPQRLTPKGRATRERIVATAAQLMYDHSIAGTSLGDVQKAAGVGPSQVYHYFEDKESLIRAVIAHRIHALLATLGGLDSMEGLRAWRDFVVDTHRRQNCEGGCPLGSLVGELAEPFPECRGDLAGGFDQWEAAIREGLRPCATGAISAARPTPTAWRPRCWPRSKAGSCSRRFAATPLLSKRHSMRSSIASRTSGPDARRPVGKAATLPLPSRRCLVEYLGATKELANSEGLQLPARHE